MAAAASSSTFDSKNDDGDPAIAALMAAGEERQSEGSSLVQQMDATIGDLAEWRRKQGEKAAAHGLADKEADTKTDESSNDAVPLRMPIASTSSRVQHFEALPRNELITEAALHNSKLDALRQQASASTVASEEELLRSHAASIAKQRMLELGLDFDDGDEGEAEGALAGAGAAATGKEGAAESKED